MPDQRAFVTFVLEECEANWDRVGGFLPHQLKESVVKQTLLKWCDDQTIDSRPFRWYGRVFKSETHLSRAVEIDPLDDVARTVLLNWMIDQIDYSLHHMPEGYIGDPVEDLAYATQLQGLIEVVQDVAEREAWQGELDFSVELINNYLDWRKSGHPNLEAWGAENNKRVGFRN